MMGRENLHQRLATANVLYNMFMIGTTLGWITPAINKFQKGEGGFTVTSGQISWIGSIFYFGCFFGPLLTAIFLDKLGRKPAVFMCSLSIFFSWLIMYFAHSIEIIYCVRFLGGLTLGAMDVINSIYIAENCTPKMRGLTSGIFPLCFSTANIIQYTLLAYKSFAFVAVVNAAMGFGAFITSIFLKETPYYLMMKGQPEEAKKNLLWLRGRKVIDDDTQHELDQIQQNMQTEVLKKRSLASLFGSPENYKSLLMTVTLNLSTPAIGMSSLFVYCSIILQPSSITVETFTIMLGVVQLISACLLPFIIERYNRRTLMLNCLCSMGICHLCIFLLYWKKMSIPDECFSWLVFLAVTSCFCICAIYYPAMTILRSELLPTSVRAIGGSLNVMTSSISSALFVQLFVPVKTTIGIEWNFIIFLFGCILQYIFVLKVLHETRGKTLVDIQMTFDPSK